MEEETFNRPPHYGATPVVDQVPTDTPANHVPVTATDVPSVAPSQDDQTHPVAPPVVSPTSPTVGDGRHTMTIGDAVRLGRELGYERTSRKWQVDCKREIVDAVKRGIGEQEAWFLNEQSVRDRIAALKDRAGVRRTAPASQPARPVAPTQPNPTPRPTPTVEPTPGTTGGDRRMSDAALDDTDPFEMPDEPMLLKKYIYKQRNRLELARMKEEQLDKALVDQREEVKSIREFLGGEKSIIRALSDAVMHLRLGTGKPDDHDRQ